eukprot:848103-Prorocentrum_minimum.AAC.2
MVKRGTFRYLIEVLAADPDRSLEVVNFITVPRFTVAVITTVMGPKMQNQRRTVTVLSQLPMTSVRRTVSAFRRVNRKNHDRSIVAHEDDKVP